MFIVKSTLIEDHVQNPASDLRISVVMFASTNEYQDELLERELREYITVETDRECRPRNIYICPVAHLGSRAYQRVRCSRVKSSRNLAFLNSFPFQQVQRLNDARRMRIVAEEMQRLAALQ